MKRVVRSRVSAQLFAVAVVGGFIGVFSWVSVWATRSHQLRSDGQETVWDGVYTVEQAARGRTAYERNCGHCHSDGDAPSVVGDAFIRKWFGDSLNVPLAKVRDTMPGDAPASLTDSVYVDILSFLLEVTGFPAGAEELSHNPEMLTNILIVQQDGPGVPVPNFSLVMVVGCLTQGAGDGWMLMNSTDPVRTRDPGDSAPVELRVSETEPLGRRTFRLLDVPLAGRGYLGGKVQATGFLILDPNEDRLNLTSLVPLGQRCAA